MKAFLVLLGLILLFSMPANAQVAQSYASSKEFKSSQSYLGYGILMDGLKCLREIGLNAEEMPTDNAGRSDIELQLNRCMTSLDVIMERLDALFAKDTVEVLRHYYDSGLVPASNRYVACLNGDTLTCEAQEGGIGAAIHLIEASSRSMEAKLGDWYLGIYCELADLDEADSCDAPVVRTSEDVSPPVGPKPEELHLSFDSEDEFLNSRSFFAYELLQNGLECLDEGGLYSPALSSITTGERFALFYCTRIFQSVYELTMDEPVFPPDLMRKVWGATWIAPHLSEYFRCLEHECIDPAFAESVGLSTDTYLSWARESASSLSEGLGRWHQEVWCPLSPDAEFAVVCIESGVAWQEGQS